MSVSRHLRNLSRGLRKDSLARQLRIESLEDRRLLAVMLVTDLGDGSLENLAGDGELSLREAVAAINTGAPVDGIGPAAGVFGDNDAIIFSAGLFGGLPKTLALTAGQLELTSGVNIAGPTGQLLTIDAEQNSRLFDIAEGSDDYAFSQLLLTGGLTTELQAQGGAIRSLTSGELSMREVAVTLNATAGNFSGGGGVAAMGSVVMVDSSITDNFTLGSGSGGGGIATSGDLSLTRTSITDNRTEGNFASGGGLSASGMVTLSSSTVSGNSTIGMASSAGGVLGFAGVTMTESTISGNQTSGETASAAGVSSGGTVTVTRSTIVDNRALGGSATGGGVQTFTTNVVVSGSIIANNFANVGNPEIDPGTGAVIADHSLIGDATGLGITPATNLLNQDPRLGPLSGGGATKTRAPLPGSPVIDAGDALIAAPPTYDQRGAPFSRIANGDGSGAAVIDIGSHEVQFPADADFDKDFVGGLSQVNGADFLAWQRGFGRLSNAVAADGNSDEDGDVDNQDLAVWQVQFGDTIADSLGLPVQTTTDDRAGLVDLALAVELTEQSLTAPRADVYDQSTAEVAEGTRQQAFAALRPTTSGVADELGEFAAADDRDEAADSDSVFGEELVSVSLVVLQ